MQQNPLHQLQQEYVLGLRKSHQWLRSFHQVHSVPRTKQCQLSIPGLQQARTRGRSFLCTWWVGELWFTDLKDCLAPSWRVASPVFHCICANASCLQGAVRLREAIEDEGAEVFNRIASCPRCGQRCLKEGVFAHLSVLLLNSECLVMLALARGKNSLVLMAVTFRTCTEVESNEKWEMREKFGATSLLSKSKKATGTMRSSFQDETITWNVGLARATFASCARRESKAAFPFTSDLHPSVCNIPTDSRKHFGFCTEWDYFSLLTLLWESI